MVTEDRELCPVDMDWELGSSLREWPVENEDEEEMERLDPIIIGADGWPMSPAEIAQAASVPPSTVSTFAMAPSWPSASSVGSSEGFLGLPPSESVVVLPHTDETGMSKLAERKGSFPERIGGFGKGIGRANIPTTIAETAVSPPMNTPILPSFSHDLSGFGIKCFPPLPPCRFLQKNSLVPMARSGSFGPL